jgi:hypothetical protein
MIALRQAQRTYRSAVDTLTLPSFADIEGDRLHSVVHNTAVFYTSAVFGATQSNDTTLLRTARMQMCALCLHTAGTVALVVESNTFINADDRWMTRFCHDIVFNACAPKSIADELIETRVNYSNEDRLNWLIAEHAQRLLHFVVTMGAGDDLNNDKMTLFDEVLAHVTNMCQYPCVWTAVAQCIQQNGRVPTAITCRWHWLNLIAYLLRCHVHFNCQPTPDHLLLFDQIDIVDAQSLVRRRSRYSPPDDRYHMPDAAVVGESECEMLRQLMVAVFAQHWLTHDIIQQWIVIGFSDGDNDNKVCLFVAKLTQTNPNRKRVWPHSRNCSTTH